MQVSQQCSPAFSISAQGAAKSIVSRILVFKSFVIKDLAPSKPRSSNLTPANPKI
jgi:hypothetical protein